MGYNTDFVGEFFLDKDLDDDTYNLLMGLNDTRRMMRQHMDEKYGVDGEFYVGGDEGHGDPSIVDYNTPPFAQPGLWCQWAPTSKRTIEWDQGGKFYYATEWIQYIIERVLIPRGYVLNGEVKWYGEESCDMGVICISANIVTEKIAKITYE